MQAEVDRLRKHGWKKLREEQLQSAHIQKQHQQQEAAAAASSSVPSLAAAIKVNLPHAHYKASPLYAPTSHLMCTYTKQAARSNCNTKQGARSNCHTKQAARRAMAERAHSKHKTHIYMHIRTQNVHIAHLTQHALLYLLACAHTPIYLLYPSGEVGSLKGSL